MRYPSSSGIWPGWAAISSPEPEQPQVGEAAQLHNGLHPREPMRLRRSTVLSLGREDSRSPLAMQPSREDSGAVGGEVENPKTPCFRLGMLSFTSSRSQLPHLSRTGIAGSNATNPWPVFAAVGQPPALDEPSGRLRSVPPEQTMSRVIAGPQPVAVAPEPQAGSRMWSFSGAMLREEPRDIGHEDAHAGGAITSDAYDAAGTGEGLSRRFMCCLPGVRSRRAMAQIMRCLVSGLFLIALLATCTYPLTHHLPQSRLRWTRVDSPAVDLALSITGSIINNELSILLILIIISTTIFFCHGLIRLCMLATRPRRNDDDRPSSPLPGVMAFTGSSLPRRPIRVVLARDEEAAGIESDTANIRPPAYGVWRESVVRRCNVLPDRTNIGRVKCRLANDGLRSASTPTASSGSAAKQNKGDALCHPRQPRRPGPSAGRRHTPPTMVSATW